MTQAPPNAETFKTELPQVIDLFTLDISPILPPASSDQSIYRFANWSQVNGQDVVYKTNTYTALPLEADGFELNTSGQLARPTLNFANVGLGITALTNTYDDLVGATVQRIRTLSTYLDGEQTQTPMLFGGLMSGSLSKKAMKPSLWCLSS